MHVPSVMSSTSPLSPKHLRLSARRPYSQTAIKSQTRYKRNKLIVQHVWHEKSEHWAHLLRELPRSGVPLRFYHDSRGGVPGCAGDLGWVTGSCNQTGGGVYRSQLGAGAGAGVGGGPRTKPPTSRLGVGCGSDGRGGRGSQVNGGRGGRARCATDAVESLRDGSAGEVGVGAEAAISSRLGVQNKGR